MPPGTPTFARCQFAARVESRIPDHDCACVTAGTMSTITNKRSAMFPVFAIFPIIARRKSPLGLLILFKHCAKIITDSISPHDQNKSQCKNCTGIHFANDKRKKRGNPTFDFPCRRCSLHPVVTLIPNGTTPYALFSSRTPPQGRILCSLTPRLL